jgi:hypothetical protein
MDPDTRRGAHRSQESAIISGFMHVTLLGISSRRPKKEPRNTPNTRNFRLKPDWNHHQKVTGKYYPDPLIFRVFRAFRGSQNWISGSFELFECET